MMFRTSTGIHDRIRSFLGLDFDPDDDDRGCESSTHDTSGSNDRGCYIKGLRDNLREVLNSAHQPCGAYEKRDFGANSKSLSSLVLIPDSVLLGRTSSSTQGEL
ncbi:hypothetical protein NL676_004660 [Syzygium grande]|nr:hypothetical protein NL676_004660 [Syzygium grande]